MPTSSSVDGSGVGCATSNRTLWTTQLGSNPACGLYGTSGTVPTPCPNKWSSWANSPKGVNANALPVSENGADTVAWITVAAQAIGASRAFFVLRLARAAIVVPVEAGLQADRTTARVNSCALRR